MKRKKIIIALILILLVVIIIVCFIVFCKNSNNQNFQDLAQRPTRENSEGYERMETEEQGNRIQTEQITTLSNSSEVKSALTENVELHATYYLSEIYVEKNQYVEKDANILKYTNGEYLTAPYDCYIVELNLPELEDKCLNSNYIQIQSKNMLSVSINVDEAQIEKVNVGGEATIEVKAIDKKYAGYVTHIRSTANNGKFEVTIEFENDGNVMIGMTSNVEMTI